MFANIIVSPLILSTQRSGNGFLFSFSRLCYQDKEPSHSHHYVQWIQDPSIHYFVGSLHMRMRGYYWHLQLKIIFYTRVCITWPFVFFFVFFVFLDILAVRFLIVTIYLPLPFPKRYRFEKGHCMPIVCSH